MQFHYVSQQAASTGQAVGVFPVMALAQLDRTPAAADSLHLH
jgi:hypothetical protein